MLVIIVMLRFKSISLFFNSLLLFLASIMVLFASDSLHYQTYKDTVPQPLSNSYANPEKGKQLVIDRNKGNCLSCHQLPIPEEEFHGTIGPSLTQVSSRLTPEQIRLRIIDMKRLNPLTIMPSYFQSTTPLNRISSQFEGTTLLTPDEIEHIIAYLMTLKSEHTDLRQ